MPGNEVEDGVHNFFAQDDLSSGHHQSQAADGSWQGLGNNLWPGSQSHNGLPSSNLKGYNLQLSDSERGQTSHSFQVAQGLNYAQPTIGPELARSHSQGQLPNSNGYMNGRQFLQTRQNNVNFLGVDTESNRYNSTISRGLPVYESQGGNSLENSAGSVRSESSESRIGFDFLGGRQQMGEQQMGMPQSLPQQLSGFNDMQLLHQQVMLRKMQELQRQQREARHNNSLNQNSSIINGTPISPVTAASNNTWQTETSSGNKSWFHRATQAAQGSPNELGSSPEQGQTLSLMGLNPQPVDQSVYGLPVSDTRGTPSHYSHVSVDNQPVQQMTMYSNSSTRDQFRGPMDQVNVQDGSLGTKHGFPEDFFLGQPSGQSIVRGMYSGNPQLVSSLQGDSPVQELAGPSETMEGKAKLPDSSSHNAVALDPTEEKILFGDGNIWDSFGDDAATVAGGGSWSALMQSAVAETSNDIGLQEEGGGPSFNRTEVVAGSFSGDVNTSKNFQGVQGFHQSVQKYPYEHAQIYQNTTCSSDAIVNAKSMPGSWAPQHNIPFHISGQVYGKPNGRDDVETTPSSRENDVSRFHGNESRLQQSGSNDQMRMWHRETSQGGVHIWKPVPGPQSIGGLEQLRSGMGSSQVNREEMRLMNHPGRPNSSTGRASEGASPNSDNLNFWKHGESSSMRKGNEQHLNKGSLVMESSMNGSGNDVMNMYETGNRERTENSSESHHSNKSQHTTAGVANDKVPFEVSDTRNSLEGKQKVSGQGGQKVSGSRKFQYHPMGNLDEDVESSFGRKSVTSNQSQGYLSQPKFFAQFPKTSSEREKVNMFGVQQNKMEAIDLPSKGTLAGFAPNISQSSQNVPEFPHMMDQSKEKSTSDGSVGPYKQSPSHGFGLQLGFPSHLLPSKTSDSSAQLAGSLTSFHTTPEMREKDSISKAESFPSLPEISKGEHKRNEIGGTCQSSNDAPQYSMKGNLNSVSTPGFPFARNRLHGQEVGGAVDRHVPHSSQTKINKKDRLLSSGDTSQHTNIISSREKVPIQEVSVGRVPNAWTKPFSQQNLLGGQLHNKSPAGIFRPGQFNNNAMPTSSSPQVGVYWENQQAKESLHRPVPSADLAPKPSVSQGKDSVIKIPSDAAPSDSASTERDFEAFGRSLKPSNLPPQNYSLLNQMRAMKSTDIDPGNRDLKRFKGGESSVGSQMRQLSEQNIVVGDPKFLRVSGSAGPVDNINSLTRDVLAPSRMDPGNYPCGSSTSSLKVEHSQISPQMAPSWFEQYGTFKNGQMLSMSDAHNHSTIKTIEQHLPHGKSSDTLLANNMTEQANATADSNLAGNIWQKSVPTPVKVENMPSTQYMDQDVTDKDLAVARPMKRKSTALLLSWHKEVTESSQSLLTASMAEVEWAKAANRLIDKVDNGAETYEGGPPSRRSKRRLILTTQLMQQIFWPPVARILSADAYSNYEAVACMGARLALGDACCLISCSKSSSCSPLDNINSLIDKHTTESKRISEQRLSEVTEHFISRAKKLENDFMRLDRRASVVDLRGESQDLDKVSLINRFAKFHGRGQADLAPPVPQRYVNALPISRVLPERVQCLSL